MEHRERHSTFGWLLDSKRTFLLRKSVNLSFLYLKYHLPKFVLIWWITRESKKLKKQIYHTPSSFVEFTQQCPCLICNLSPKEIPRKSK